MRVEEIQNWEAFQAVALHSSFTQAARALRTGVPQLSKRIARLEDLLGVKLFNRSTRIVSLSDEGKALLPRVSAVLEDLSAIESSFESKKMLSGLIRITSVQFIAQRLLLPLVDEFRKRHPEVRFEIQVSESILNLIEANIDLAIRVEDEPEDSSLIYRKLGSNELVIAATPAYLKKCPHPILRPEDLREHEILLLNVHENLKFQKSGTRLKTLIKKRSLACNDAWVLTQLALNGSGVLVRSYWDVHEYIQRGELVQILKKYPLENFGNIYVVIPSRKFIAPRVRAFVDFIAAETPHWIKNPRRI